MYQSQKHAGCSEAGVAPERAAQADLQTVMQRLAREYPNQDAGHTAKVVSFQDWSLEKRFRDRLLVLQITALGLCLMACANLSGLLLARLSARRRELEIRAAWGSSRGRGRPDWKLVFSVIAIAVAGAIAMGLTTVVHDRSQVSGLSAGGRIAADRSGVFTRKMLVVFQLSCAVVLLTATVSTLQSFWARLHVDPGFDRSRFIAMRVSLPQGSYRTGAGIGERFEKTAASVAAVPGVRTRGGNQYVAGCRVGIQWQHERGRDASDHPGFFAEYRWVTSAHLQTMGIPLLCVRQFLSEERAGNKRRRSSTKPWRASDGAIATRPGPISICPVQRGSRLSVWLATCASPA